MDDLISRQAAIDHLTQELWCLALQDEAGREYYEDIAFTKLENWINELPSAQKHGKWIKHGIEEGHLIEKYTCSECDYYSGLKTTNFCPNCGADMRCKEGNA